MKTRSLIITVITILGCVLGTRAKEIADPVIDDIVRSYQPWNTAEFSGKLKYEKLPLTPNVKIYMVRDSLLQLSVRAPFVGEVGRIQITKDEFLAVNKLKRTYCRESAARLFDMYPGALGDLQSLFLARVVLLGDGELSSGNSATFDVEEDGEGNWMLLPQLDPGVIPFNYGYLVSQDSKTRALMAAMAGKGTLQILYSYQNRGLQMEIELDRPKGKKFEASLDFTSVKWGGSPMSPIKLTNYRQLGLKEFIRTLR